MCPNSSISPKLDRMPAPYALTSPCSRMTPNSIENQNTSAMNFIASSVSTRSEACPAASVRQAKRGDASWFACPMTSWMMSGSGV